MDINVRPLKIVHVITRLINGGADENTVISCNQAAAAGHEVFLIHGFETHREIVSKVSKNVTLIEVKSLARRIDPFNDIKACYGLARIYRKIKPDVIHTHTSKAGVLGRLATIGAGVRLVVHGVHIASFENVSWLQRRIYLAAEKTVDGVTDVYIDVSQGMKKLYLDAGFGTEENHYIIPSGFDLDLFKQANLPSDWAVLAGLSDEEPRPPILLMMAAFEPRKRHLEFLVAFSKVVKRFPEIRLLLAGDGKLKSEIEALVRLLDIGKNVKIIGYRNDPERLIALADICLISSVHEGLPRVVMQYLAGGKPCVATDLPGLKHVLDNDINGIVISDKENGINRMVDSIITLLADKVKYEALVSGARATDLSAWDERHMGKNLEQIYRTYITATDKK
jgi:glycosyltransferase involved in cell wall biosynthesis